MVLVNGMPRPSVMGERYSRRIMQLWDAGCDTWVIGKHLGLYESQVYNTVAVQRELRLRGLGVKYYPQLGERDGALVESRLEQAQKGHGHDERHAHERNHDEGREVEDRR